MKWLTLLLTLAFCGLTHGHVAYFADDFDGGPGQWLGNTRMEEPAGNLQGTVQYSNHMCYAGTTNLNWSSISIRPLDIGGDIAAFDAWNSTGTTVKFLYDGWASDRTSSVLHVYITSQTANLGELWDFWTTGVHVRLIPQGQPDGSTNMLVDCWRKGTNVAIGGYIWVTNAPWQAGAEVEVSMDESRVRMSFAGNTLIDRPHGIASGWSNWYVMLCFQNNGVPAFGSWLIDDLEVIGPYPRIDAGFVSDFTGTDGNPPDPAHWELLSNSATAYLSNNACVLIPQNIANANATLMPKTDADNPLRLDPAPWTIVTTMDVREVTCYGPRSGSDVVIQQDFFPAEWRDGMWGYNNTGLSVFVYVDYEVGSTTVFPLVWYHDEYGVAGYQIGTWTQNVAYVTNAQIVCELDGRYLSLSYNSVKLNTEDVELTDDIADLFRNGVWTTCGIQIQPDVVDVSAHVDSYAIHTTIPEPAAASALLAAIWVLRRRFAA